MIYIERTAEQQHIRIPLLTWINRDELTLYLTLRSTVGNEVGGLEVTGIAKGRYDAPCRGTRKGAAAGDRLSKLIKN